MLITHMSGKMISFLFQINANNSILTPVANAFEKIVAGRIKKVEDAP